jgi:hypothetical protein
MPRDGSSSVISYIIRIRQNDNVTFTENTVYCNGSLSNVISSQSCTIPITVLLAAPYNLVWGSSVYAKVTAINSIGISVESNAGNGAVLMTLPGAPTNLINVVSITTATQIGLSWTAGSYGGSTIISYTVLIYSNVTQSY